MTVSIPTHIAIWVYGYQNSVQRYPISNLRFVQLVATQMTETTPTMDVWFDPRHPVSYTGVNKLAKTVKQSRRQTQRWLGKQLAYSLNKPMRKRFPTRAYRAAGVNNVWQMDLMEMIPYASINDGYRYVLTCIDVFSRFARAVAVKTKSGKEIADAVRTLVNQQPPKHVQTDLGKEFYNSHVASVLKEFGVNHYSVFSQYKAALVERFNRTLRSRLNKLFTKQGTKRWVNVLQDIIHAYNHSAHRGINGLRPIDVTDDLDMWLYQNRQRQAIKRPKYKIGDWVRISKISTTPFIKNFSQNWSDEVFRISAINTKQTPVMYVLQDEHGEEIRGKFYEQELQVLPEKPDVYRIEEILRSRGKGENKQYLVKWHGYTEPSWIFASQIE